MPQLTITLSPERIPAEIQFADEQAWDVAPTSTNGLSSEADWLCLMALYTALRRVQTDGEDCSPSLTDVHHKHAKTIVGSVYGKQNFSKKNQLEIPLDKNGDYKRNEHGEIDDQRHWLVKIFGEPPVKKYLLGSRSSGAERLKFTSDVEIVILKETLSGNFVEVKEALELRECFLHFKRDLLGLEKDLYLKIEIEDPFSEEAPWQLIDSRECEGKIRSGTFFNISAIATYETEFAMFWVATSLDVYSLYPFSSPEGEIDKISTKLDNGTLVKVGESCQFEVHPPEGFDICVLITRDKKFTKSETEKIRIMIEESLEKISLKERLLGNSAPRIEKFSVAKKRNKTPSKKSNTRFGIRKKRDSWKCALAKSLEAKATTLCLFSIPNKQS